MGINTHETTGMSLLAMRFMPRGLRRRAIFTRVSGVSRPDADYRRQAGCWRFRVKLAWRAFGDSRYDKLSDIERVSTAGDSPGAAMPADAIAPFSARREPRDAAPRASIGITGHADTPALAEWLLMITVSEGAHSRRSPCPRCKSCG